MIADVLILTHQVLCLVLFGAKYCHKIMSFFLKFLPASSEYFKNVHLFSCSNFNAPTWFSCLSPYFGMGLKKLTPCNENTPSD